MLSQLIQQQIPLGGKVKFILTSGREISGILAEIGRDHVAIETKTGFSKLPLERVDFWETPNNEEQEFSPKTEICEDKAFEIKYSSNTQINEISALNLNNSHNSHTDDSNKNDENDKIVETISSSNSFAPEVFKTLIEIEAQFDAKIKTSKIDLIPPDFIFPTGELKGNRQQEANKIWIRAKNKYDDAVKNNELGSKFGRLPSIVQDLRLLNEWFSTSSSTKRHLAFLEFLSGNKKESLKHYKSSAISSKAVEDWYNVAVIATEINDNTLACYALTQFFTKADLHSEKNQNAWYMYVGILHQTSNFCLLSEVNLDDSPEIELRTLLETEVYLLKATDRSDLATNLVQQFLQKLPLQSLVRESLKYFSGALSERYQLLQKELGSINQKNTQKYDFLGKTRGDIYTYDSQRIFGFIRGSDGIEYLFHRSAVIDEELLRRINNLQGNKKIPVIFEPAQGAKGALAIGVSLYRTIEQLFNLAIQYANDGDYSKAIAQARKVLALNPDYPEAQQLHEKWREYARLSGVPRGSNSYARARRVQLIEKDLDKAASLFLDAIKRGDNLESAIKDLAQLLVQRGREGDIEEAIKVLTNNRYKISNQRSLDNLLINVYQKAGQYDQALKLLNKQYKDASTRESRSQILFQIANCYLGQENYVDAEKAFRQVIDSGFESKAAQRNVALCLIKQKCYDEAELILNGIIDTSSDVKASELLAAITQEKETGKSAKIDEIITEVILSDFSSEISQFTRFFLERCEYQGVQAERVQKQVFNRSDIRDLEKLATQLGTKRPIDRSIYYLSAAKIASILEDDYYLNQFYSYLCRSFASKGDAIISDNKPLDAARESYCEALSVYDAYRNPGQSDDRYDEQDAINALCRYIYSYLGRESVPTTPPRRNENEPVHKQQVEYINQALENVLPKHPKREKVFDAILQLISRSRYAASKLLNLIYAQEYTLRPMALDYIKSKNLSVSGDSINQEEFIRLWNELRRKIFEETNNISNELRFVAKFELTTASIENSIKTLREVASQLFLDLDQQRIVQLQKIFEASSELCKQTTFEEQERLCFQIDQRCESLTHEIEISPTKISVEEIYPIVDIIQQKAKKHLDEIYESSVPQLILRMAEGLDSYSHDNNQNVEVQIVVENRMGCSPAESLELFVQGDEEFFIITKQEIKLDGSLRGGTQEILTIPVHLTEQAIRSETFSLPVYAQYRTRSEDIAQTQIANFSIRLYSEEQFEEIENPYAAYAGSAIVQNKDMFYGRNELITNTSRTIRNSHSQNKCLVIFGQKRSGKSSILHHLKLELQEDKDLLILDIGNIGSILDEYSSNPLLYQILWSIIRQFEYAIEDKFDDGYSKISIDFPTDLEFYNHPSPLSLFKDIFERFKRNISKIEDWKKVRVVILIDEFSYIYSQIVSGKVTREFMKNWKALLQANFFSAVLVGQDVMPKFKQNFPNEFGIIQDERVSYLKPEDAIKLIDEPIRIGGKNGKSRYVEKAIDRIVELTAGSPFYIQILCNRLVEYMNRKRAKLVTKSDVEQIKSDLIQGVNALSIDKFDNLISSGDTSADAISDEDARKVLASIAENSLTGACSRHTIVCETQTPVDEILKDLENREVVKQEQENYYRIRVELFKEWLIAHPQ
jgi:tetratricopeptide (TPR) repeat protein